MSNYEKIYDYLDGTLEGLEEEQLFNALAGDSELRSELKQQLALKTAIRSDVAAFTPKAASTLKIFSELGLVMPAPAPTPIPTMGTKIITMLKANSAYIYTGLLSAAAAVAIIFTIFDFGNSTSNINLQNNNSNLAADKNIPVISSFANNSETNEISKNSNYNSNNNDPSVDLKQPKIVYKYVYINKSDDKVSKSNADENSNYNLSQTVLSPDISESTVELTRNEDNYSILNIRSSNSNSLSPSPELISNFIFPETGILIGSDFSVELRGSSYQTETNRELNQHNSFDFENMAFAFLYDLSNEIKAGIEYRRENYYQKFTGFDNDVFYVFEQQPNFETISLVAKYNPDFVKLDRFSPFILGSIGANIAGPVSRIMIGTDVNFGGAFYLNFGYDYSMMIYSQNSERFIASKPGFHLGAGINF